MVSKIKLVIILLSIPTLSRAGDDSTSRCPFENQLAFNATNFIKVIASPSNFYNIAAPFDLNYKLLYKNRKGSYLSSMGLRAGLGYRQRNNDMKDPITGNTTVIRNRTLNFRLGLEVQKTLNRFWTVYLGADYAQFSFLRDERSKYEVNGIKYDNHRQQDYYRHGFGPVFGVQFNMNRYMSLGTELSFYFLQGRTVDFYRYGTIDTPAYWQVGRPKESEIMLPDFVYFIARF